MNFSTMSWSSSYVLTELALEAIVEEVCSAVFISKEVFLINIFLKCEMKH